MTYNPNQGQWAPQGAPQGGYYAPPPQNNGGGNTLAWVIAAVALTALLLVGGFVGYKALAGEDSGNSSGNSQPAMTARSDAPASSNAGANSSSQAAATSAAPAAPVQKPAQRAPAVAGYNNYDYNSVTSSSFAANVYSAWKDNYAATGSKNATLSVYSPYTGGTYVMSCYPSGSAVRCTGGDNAMVSIY